MRSGIQLSLYVSVVFNSALTSSAWAAVYNLSPADDWFGVLGCDGCTAGDLLQPGDEVILQPGVYSDSRRINLFHRGTAENPIVISAADPNNKPIFQRPLELNAYSSRNHVLNLEGSQYLKLNGLEVTGGAWGVRIGSTLRPANPAFFPSGIEDRGPLPQAEAKFVTLENLYVHDTGATGITANMDGDHYEGIVICNSEITRLGQGDAGIYLGCNNVGAATSCVFRDGLVERNYIHNIDNGNSNSVGDGIQIKDGSYNNIVRDNVVHNTGGFGAVGILVYGTDGNAPNIIERNVIWNAGDNAIQAASEAIIRNNIIFSAGLDGISSQNHQSAVVGNLTIVNNTVISSNDALNISASGSLSGPIIVANNALYATAGGRGIRVPGFGSVTVVGNVGVGSSSPALSTAAWNPSGNLLTDFGSIALMDAFPVVGSKLIGAGSASFQPELDFNTTPRSGSADAGAYVFDAAGNPGWRIISAFKGFPRLPGDFDLDGDVDDADYTVWKTNFDATSGAGLDADGNGNNIVDAADYVVWRDHLGNSVLSGAASGTAAVPEPTMIALASAAGCSLLGCSRRYR